MDPARLMEFISKHPDVQFTPSGVLRIPLGGNSHAVLPQVKAVLQQLQA